MPSLMAFTANFDDIVAYIELKTELILKAEELILVDVDDNETGFLSKADCHDGDGVLHRAFSLFLFTFCMLCHGELAALKPDPAHLTAFYLCIAVGGAAGYAVGNEKDKRRGY